MKKITPKQQSRLDEFDHDFGEGYPEWNNKNKDSWTTSKVKMIKHHLLKSMQIAYQEGQNDKEKELIESALDKHNPDYFLGNEKLKDKIDSLTTEE